MHRLLPALLLLCACPPPDQDTDPADTDLDSDTDRDSDTDDDIDTGTDVLTDEARVRVALAGGGQDPSSLLAEVALSGGWPVPTDDGTWLFVVDGGAFPEPHVAGSFSDWTPEPLDCTGDLCVLERRAQVGDTYKIVSEGTFFADPWARAYTRDEHGQISLVGWPRDRWHRQRWPGVEGALGPRKVRLLVPPGDGPWSVLYAHDGQNLFDRDAPWGGWRLDQAVRELDAPILVVGLDNTPDRLAEYSVCDDTIEGMAITSQGDAYAAFVELRVRPLVEDVYGSTGVDGLIGSSMGGLASLHLALDQPGRWDFAASMSGTLGWGRLHPASTGPSIQEQYLAVEPLDTVIYVDSGGSAGDDGCTDVDGDGLVEDDPDDSDNYCVSRAFADALAAHGYTWGETLHHWHEPGAAHNEAAWASRVHQPLQIFEELARQ